MFLNRSVVVEFKPAHGQAGTPPARARILRRLVAPRLDEAAVSTCAAIHQSATPLPLQSRPPLSSSGAAWGCTTQNSRRSCGRMPRDWMRTSRSQTGQMPETLTARPQEVDRSRLTRSSPLRRSGVRTCAPSRRCPGRRYRRGAARRRPWCQRGNTSSIRCCPPRASHPDSAATGSRRR